MSALKYLFLTGILFSCDVPRTLSAGQYINLDSLLKAQTALMIQQNPQLIKTIQQNDRKETVMLKMDSIKWIQELKVLYQMDPNQAEFVNAFDVVTSRDGDLVQEVYALRKGEKGSLKKLIVTRNQEQLQHIYGLLSTENWLFSERKSITINFETNELTDYRFKGGKKMLFSDSTSYMILGAISKLN